MKKPKNKKRKNPTTKLTSPQMLNLIKALRRDKAALSIGYTVLSFIEMVTKSNEKKKFPSLD